MASPIQHDYKVFLRRTIRIEAPDENDRRKPDIPDNPFAASSTQRKPSQSLPTTTARLSCAALSSFTLVSLQFEVRSLIGKKLFAFGLTGRETGEWTS